MKAGGRVCITAGMSNEQGSLRALRQDTDSTAQAPSSNMCFGSQAPAQAPAREHKAYRSPSVPRRIENVVNIKYTCIIMVHLLSSLTRC